MQVWLVALPRSSRRTSAPRWAQRLTKAWTRPAPSRLTIAGFGDFRFETEIVPHRAVEDARLLLAVDLGVVIEAVGHPAVIERRPDRCGGHRLPPQPAAMLDHFPPPRMHARIAAATAAGGVRWPR